MATRTAKPKKRKAPTLEQILAYATADKAFWGDRNAEIEKWQKMYEMRTKKTAKSGEQTVQLNDGKVLVNKGTAFGCTDHRIMWPAPAEKPDLTAVAQKGENMLRWARAEMRIQHASGLHNPLEWEESQSVFLRGYIVGRLLLDPANPGFPWQYDLLDIANVYPRPAGKKLVRVTHQYKAKAFEIMEEFPEAKLDPTSDQDVEVIGYYDDVYMAVVVGGEFVKKPEEHGYGFNPIQVVPANGGFYAATGYDEKEWIKHRGEGILAANYDPIRDKEEVLGMMKTILAKEANPPATAFTDEDGASLDISLKPGARNVLAEKGRLELHKIGPNFQEMTAMAGGFQDQINKGGFQPSLFGDPTGTSSGFQGYLAMGSAKDVVTPYLKALEIYYTLLYRRMVQLYINFGADELTFYGINAKSGQIVSGMSVTPDELAALGPHITVRFKNNTLQDQITMAQTADLLARDKVLSLETVRGEWLGVDDPALENRKVLGEMIFMDPGVTKALAQANALALNDPVITQAIQAQQAAQMPQAAVAAAGVPPGAPEGTTPGAPPEAPQGLPPNVLPPEAGINAGAFPRTDLLGGMGSGPDQGVPPDILRALGGI